MQFALLDERLKLHERFSTTGLADCDDPLPTPHGRSKTKAER
jgi:hypothetical protein